MSCLGGHFALTNEEAEKLLEMDDEDDCLEYLQEVIEEMYFKQFPSWKAESDKAWDAMHRTLADGYLTWKGGSYPLNHTVLAGELLYTERDYIMSLKDPSEVRDIAAALSEIAEEEFRRRYFQIDAKDYGFSLSEEDFAYTWEWFQGVRDLYARAAKEGRYVLFTADQ